MLSKRSLLVRRLATVVLSGLIALPALSQTPAALSDAAYALLLERATAARNNFFIYQDAGSGLNHGDPSGVFGTFTKVHLNAACIDDASGAVGAIGPASRGRSARRCRDSDQSSSRASRSRSGPRLGPRS